MKYLYLMRHAKASLDEIGISDFDRSLHKRGKKNAQFMAERLKEFDIKFDLILASPAKRAKKTVETVVQTIDYEKSDIVFSETLYDSTLDRYMYLLDSLEDDLNSLLIVAHNPTLTEIGEYLSGAILTNMPTSSIVCIEFDTDSFKNLEEGSGKILFFDYPKKHEIE